MSTRLPSFASSRAQELLGYLNFSAGAADPQFLAALAELWRAIEEGGPERDDSWRVARDYLVDQLSELERQGGAFRDVGQARAVLAILFEHVVPRYRAWHRDLLFHLSDARLWRPFLVGRAVEAILAEGAPWDEFERIVEGALRRLNDFVGHRPVAVLQRAQRLEPYRHEWVRPIPLYVRGTGVAPGRYERLITQALEILQNTDDDLLADAQFDPELLDELALDPREYDFEHPVNKRPNYQMGQWDPRHLDSQGRYRRYVLVGVTLEGLLDRPAHPGALNPDELLFEAAAVLAGTMLMGSGISGASPEAHDSTISISTLLPHIAEYRDSFYQRLLESRSGVHRERLAQEALQGRQPFAGARRRLNEFLVRKRAEQLLHVRLALFYARLGYPDAAEGQTAAASVATARMTTAMECRITTAGLALDRDSLSEATALAPEIVDLVHRAVDCGAMVDPWNILGFQGQFSLFPAPENSVPDHRVDELIELLEQFFAIYARLWAEAAARADGPLQATISESMSNLARWWDQFAATTVESVEAFSGSEAFESARRVAEALEAWHRGGASAGDIAFWRKHVEYFNSPKAYATVVGALLDKKDFVAARALLVQWLSMSEETPLMQGRYSFHSLARRWLDEVCAHQPDAELVEKFFDFVEANAEEFWQLPDLARQRQSTTHDSMDDGEDEVGEEEEGEIFRAAYEEMVYTDSTDDGVEGATMESGAPADDGFPIEADAQELRDRVMMLGAVASLWRLAATAMRPRRTAKAVSEEALARWLERAQANHRQLLALVEAVSAASVPAPTTNRDSMLEFERRRSLKESLLEGMITATMATASTARLLAATIGQPAGYPLAGGDSKAPDSDRTQALWRAILAEDATNARDLWPEALAELSKHKLLYIPLARGGDPMNIVAVRDAQQKMRELAQALPRLGLLGQACQLVSTARQMETSGPIGQGAVSEFDRLFDVAARSMIESLITVSETWDGLTGPAAMAKSRDDDLIDCLELLTEGLLKQWLAHSRTLRLSVVEKISEERSWNELVAFIAAHGRELFTQRFLYLSNLRAILHQGVDVWLARLEADPDAADDFPLLTAIAGGLDRDEAIRHLSVAIEAVAENYHEYRDYNSTTTQSDRGDLLHTFLDFLRVRIEYDRVAWHLRPVLLAHEILVRRGRVDAAEVWRRSLGERTSDVADRLEQRLTDLEQRYSMRLSSITDRLAERFTQPLAVDRARALVEPAMNEARTGGYPAAATLLQQEIDELSEEPTGAGHDGPSWLRSLEEEIERVRDPGANRSCADREGLIAQSPLTLEDVQRELAGWDSLPFGLDE